MAPEESDDLLVHERLEVLGVSLLIEWDVLVFLYRHGTTLTNAVQLSHLLGDSKSAVGAALDRLDSLGLIQRSRGSQGVRLFRLSDSVDSARRSSFAELMSVAEKRHGRLLLLKHLPSGSPQPPVRAGGLRLA